MKLVSIILPTYNRAALLMEAIQSILQQTYTHWELLVIDDGSDDETEQYINNIHDSRIHHHKAGRLHIIGKLKNIGLGLAKGELIAFMDSDDLWDSSKLEKQVEALEKYSDANYAIAGGYTFYEVSRPVQYYYEMREGERAGYLLEAFVRGEVKALIPTILFRRECLDKVARFDESRLFSDNAFLLELAATFKGVVLYEPLLFRRLHETNTTNANWELGYTEYIAILKAYSAKKLISDSLAKQALFKLYINYGDKCLRFGQRAKARSVFLKAWQLKPLSIVATKKVIRTIWFTT